MHASDVEMFDDADVGELCNMTRGEIRELVADAHENDIVTSRYTAASLLWALDVEPHLISKPLLLVKAALRLAINSNDISPEGLMHGLTGKGYALDAETASQVVQSVAYEGNYGAWPHHEHYSVLGSDRERHLNPRMLGSAILTLIEPQWEQTIAEYVG